MKHLFSFILILAAFAQSFGQDVVKLKAKDLQAGQIVIADTLENGVIRFVTRQLSDAASEAGIGGAVSGDPNTGGVFDDTGAFVSDSAYHYRVWGAHSDYGGQIPVEVYGLPGTSMDSAEIAQRFDWWTTHVWGQQYANGSNTTTLSLSDIGLTASSWGSYGGAYYARRRGGTWDAPLKTPDNTGMPSIGWIAFTTDGLPGTQFTFWSMQPRYLTNGKGRFNIRGYIKTDASAGTYQDCFYIDTMGQVRLLRYGVDLMTATSLGKTESANIPVFATDGTILNKAKAKIVNSGTQTGTTDGSGDITVTHNHGAAGYGIVATMEGPTPYIIMIQSRTDNSTTFRVFTTAGAAATSTAVKFDWILNE